MRYIYTSEQTKEMENHAIQTMGFPSIVLMERAAMSVAAVIMEKVSYEQKIVCVCGTGNNGGDGVAVARLLKQSGYHVALCMVGDSEQLTQETKIQVKMALNCRVKTENTDRISSADIIIDALFGIGLSRPVEGVYKEVIKRMNVSGGVIFAIDIPSGIHASTGKVMGEAVFAQETITFSAHKLGMILYPGAGYSGRIHVADIGLPAGSMATVFNPVYLYESEDIYRLPLRPEYSNKGTFGKVLVIAGSEKMSGAAYLSAKAAYTMGAGIVKVLSDPTNRNILLGQLPEILFADRKDLEEALAEADVVVMGPGMGLDKQAREIVSYVLKHFNKDIVLDGDGITLAKEEVLHENIIITPHLKEMAVFSGVTIEALRDDLILAANRISEEKECTVVLKDARTVVCGKTETYLNVSGNSGMAAAGSGDVLSGMIGGLLAGGMEPFEAAKLGVYLHGLSGDAMAKIKSKYSLMASDIIDGVSLILGERG